MERNWCVSNCMTNSKNSRGRLGTRPAARVRASDADTGALLARGRNDLRDIVRRSRRRLGRRAPDVRAAPAAPLTREGVRPPRRV